MKNLLVLKIKAFGDDVCFDSLEALKHALANQYKGRHVSFTYPVSADGKRSKVVFVSVNQDGAIFQSYGDQLPINFDEINNQLLKLQTA